MTVKQIRQRFQKRVKRWREAFKKRLVGARKQRDEHIAHVEAKQRPTVMFDSIDLSQIPKDAPAVAGYVNGRWPTYTALKKAWPRARHLSIAVTASANAECLDCEPGDATAAEAPAWVKRQQARGVKKPVVYCSLSSAQGLLTTLAKAGIKRSQVRLWTAHFTGKPHLCSRACGFGFTSRADATQFTDTAKGRNLDESKLSIRFFD